MCGLQDIRSETAKWLQKKNLKTHRGTHIPTDANKQAGKAGEK